MERNLDGISLAPVIIEEIDESQMLNLDDFVETDALQLHEVQQIQNIEDPGMAMEVDASDGEDVDSALSPEEEDELTKQFLRGELTFSEYSSRMDQDAELENEQEAPRGEKDDAIVEPARVEEKITRKRSRPRRPKRNLPLALQGLMGEANLRYAKGETELAIKICMEIIRQVPSAPEPYQTLAMIYETADPEKSLQFSLIAAHLSPKDADQWTRLADLSMEAGDYKQAQTCLTKAIQANPKDIALYQKRAHLQEKTGEKKAVFLRGYLRLLHTLGPEDGEKLLFHGKDLTQHFIEVSSYEYALDAMSQIFTKCPQLVKPEHINILAEILIAMKKFQRCLDVLTDTWYTEPTGLWVKYEEDNSGNGDKSVKKVVACGMPSDVRVDFKSKFLVTLIELDYVELAKEHFPKLLVEKPVEFGDTFLDVAESLISKKQYRMALMFLKPLIKCKEWSLAAVWLRYAEASAGCKDLKEALLAYQIVVILAPQHFEARLQLSTLYKIFGYHDQAIEILEQDLEEDLDPDVLYRRTILLLKTNKHEEFLKSGQLLLSRHCVNLRNKTELGPLMRPKVFQRLDALRLQRLSHGQELEDENPHNFLKNDRPTVEDEFALFLKMCKVACDLKKYGVLQRISFTALTTKKFERYTPRIIFLCLISCIYNKDSYYAYNLIRDLVRDCKKPNLWNLLNVVIQKSDDSRHNRFIMRLLGKEEIFSYLHVLHANNCLVSGTYKYALNDYVSLFKERPSALLALLIGITFLQMACQKFSDKKHRLLMQAIAFLKKYKDMRGKDMHQESNYNIARGLHQMGLVAGAVHFYKEVLNEKRSEVVLENRELLDLKREAAYNLHLIYMEAGNPDLARIYLDEFIVI